MEKIRLPMIKFLLFFTLVLSATPTIAASLETHALVSTSALTKVYKPDDRKLDTGKEKLKNFAKRSIEAFEKLGIPSQHEGMELLGIFSIGAFLIGIVFSIFIPILPFLFFLAAAILAVLSIFNIIQNRELTGKGFAYAAAVLSGLGVLGILASIVLLILALLSII